MEAPHPRECHTMHRQDRARVGRGVLVGGRLQVKTLPVVS